MVANNYGLKFDSVAKDRIDFSTNLTIQDLSTFSFLAWVKVGANATSAEQRAFAMRQGNSKKGIRFALTPYKGKLRFELARADNTSDTNYDVDYTWDDYWHHVAFTADVGTNKEYNIYIDGAWKQKGKIPDGGESGGNPLKISNTSSGDVHIGSWDPKNNGVHIYWDGKLDEIQLYNTILSQASIQGKMWDHIADPSTESGLIEELRFNEGTGTSTAGSKNAGWTGTLRRNGSSSSALWNSDRPFMGDGDLDEQPPAVMTMTAPTSVGSTGFTLNWNTTTDNVYVQFYEIVVATDNTFNNPVAGYNNLNVGLVATKAIAGLAPSTNYYACVRAVDAAGNATPIATYNTNAAITTNAAADLTPPTSPVVAGSSSITATQYTMNWAAATDNVAVTGYKVDVALDSDFTTYVAGFRNYDVGNVLTKVINGLSPSLKHYGRARAYDAAGNESADSNVVVTITAAPPDITPPAIVVGQPATSVGARSATANWNLGVDDVGVTGYRLDVSLLDDFSSYVTGYQNLNVGNVTSYGLTELLPNTGYYYRTRAFDAAGNVSSNTTSPIFFQTDPSSVEDGGLYEVTLACLQDAYVDQANTSTNYGSATTLAAVNDTNDKKFYVQFDLSDVVGQVINADLRLYCTDTSANLLTVQRVTGTLTEGTVTWTNSSGLTPTGSTIDFYSGPSNAWVNVDIGSLFTAGPTLYNFVVTCASTDQAVFSSKEGANAPLLIVESSPETATQLDTITGTGANLSLINYLKNPSGETGGTAYGGATGIVANAGATLLQDMSIAAYDGAYSVKVVTTTTQWDGVYFNSNSSLGIAGTGQTMRGRFFIRAASTLSTITGILRIFYTDASNSSSPLTETTKTANTYSSANGWTEYAVRTTVASGKTIDYVRLMIVQNVAGTSNTFWVDQAAVYFHDQAVAPFHGSSSTDGVWSGTTHASQSQHNGATISALVTYVGDVDDDNSAIVQYRPAGTLDWIRPYATAAQLATTFNRTTKQVTATIGPFDQGNLLMNPTFNALFTSGLDYWIANGFTTLTVVNTDGMEDVGDLGRSALKIDVTTGGAAYGAICTQKISASSGEDIRFAVYLKSISGYSTCQLVVTATNAAGTSVGTSTFSPMLTSEWQRFDMTYASLPATTTHVDVRIITGHANTMTFLADRAMVHKGAQLNPYIDGGMVGGLWTGTPYVSSTQRVFKHDTEYEIDFWFADPDGFDGSNEIGQVVRTPIIPSNPTITGVLDLTPSYDRIHVAAHYGGDDNANNSATIEYKRADMAVWTLVTGTIDRTNKIVNADIAGLYEGTTYEARVTFYDTDGVLNGTYAMASTTTLVRDISSGITEYIAYDGFALSGGEGDYWVESYDGLGLPERRLQIEDLPRMDGGVKISDWWGVREINLSGGIKGDTRAELFSNLEAIRRVLAKPDKQFVVDTISYTNRHFIATCESFEIEQDPDNILHLKWDATFQCADPFKYDASETVEANIVLTNNQTVILTNDGDVRVEPTFSLVFTNSAPASLTLFNDTAGERITPNTTFVTSDVLTIDCAKFSLKKNGVEVDFAGGFPKLVVGQNTIRVTLSTGSVSLTSRRRHKYF